MGANGALRSGLAFATDRFRTGRFPKAGTEG